MNKRIGKYNEFNLFTILTTVILINVNLYKYIDNESYI